MNFCKACKAGPVSLHCSPAAGIPYLHTQLSLFDLVSLYFKSCSFWSNYDGVLEHDRHKTPIIAINFSIDQFYNLNNISVNLLWNTLNPKVYAKRKKKKLLNTVSLKNNEGIFFSKLLKTEANIRNAKGKQHFTKSIEICLFIAIQRSSHSFRW